MSAIIEYRGERNIVGLESELRERGYQIDLLTKEHVAVSSIESIKSMRPKVLQDVEKELSYLQHGTTRQVFSRPEQAEAKLLYVIMTSPFMRRLEETRMPLKDFLFPKF